MNVMMDSFGFSASAVTEGHAALQTDYVGLLIAWIVYHQLYHQQGQSAAEKNPQKFYFNDKN